MKKQVVFTQDYTSLGMPGSGGVAAACYRAGNYVYVTGQTAFTLEGKLVGVGDAVAQARQAMENIKTLMEMAGGSLADVVKLVVYATSSLHRATAQPIIRGYFPAVLPCETSFVIKGLGREELLVEIDAWGFIDGARTKKQLISVHDGTGAATRGSGGRVAECYRAGNLVALRSQGRWSLEGKAVGMGDPAAQARQAMENIKTLMAMAGGGLSDVARTIYTVTERDNRYTAYPVVGTYFERGALPAGTGLIVNGLTNPESLIEIDAWGWIDTPEARKRIIRTHDLGPAGMPGNSGGQAVQCCRAGNWVFIQGQVGWTLEAAVVAVGDPAAQARQAMQNIKTLMEMAGGKLSDVVRLVVYVTDREVRKSTYPVIRQFVGDLWPCGTGVVVKGLAREEFLIEIDAYGFIDDPS
jgi:enamine deaminase RidA (YjgF/YER057c/UK114 family)